jgi:DNA-binding winged helix-turn-helix (wHTH) protein
VKLCFGPFILDLDARQLTRRAREIHLAPKAFELLAMLAESRPSVLSKALLQQRLWPATFVVEANLSNLVAEIRAALGDHAHTPMFIRTVHARGYAFCGDVTTRPDTQARPSGAASSWLLWDMRCIPLAAGTYILGRDLDADIRLDASSVSRRHARLVVTDAQTMVEDLGSKNGTFRGPDPVTTAIPLVDGDVIRIGSLLVTFHVRAPLGITDTHVEAAP